MKKNNRAVSPVISAVLALMIVTSTMTAVFVWGVPYIDQINTVTSIENSLNQFTSFIDSIGELTNSYVNDSRINTLGVSKGSVSAGVDEGGKDRVVVTYSYDEGYDFTVSGLDTCFLAGTKVLMADESYKNIEEINIGDMVLSYDEHLGRVVSCRVVNVFAHHPSEMGDYYLVINDGLRVTPNHRFYSNGRWVYAGNLRVGDPLFGKDMGSNYQVVSIKKIYEREQSFDLEVEGCHTYFVSVGGVDVLVHNDDVQSPENKLVLYPEKDTHIREFHNTKTGEDHRYLNFGGSPKLSVDLLADLSGLFLGREHILIKFDLTSIPIGSTIVSAKLGLYYYEWGYKNLWYDNPSGKKLECHRLKRDWKEGNGPDEGIRGNANWFNSTDDEKWDILGGDYDNAVTASAEMPNIGKDPPYDPAWIYLDVKSDVIKFLNDVTNHGWLLKYEDPQYGVIRSFLANFTSNETTVQDPNTGDIARPKLEIIYLKTETLGATNVQKNRATLKGKVVSYGNGCKYGFYYRKYGTDNWFFTGWPNITMMTNGEFSKTIQGLSPGCLYEYRASIKCTYQSTDYINNGSIMYFLTPGEITNFNATAVTPRDIILKWDLVDNAKGAYIEWFTTPPPSPWNPEPYNQSRNKVGIDGYCEGESFQHTGLTPRTTYYYKAWAYARNSGWISNGSATAPFGNTCTKEEETFDAPIIFTYPSPNVNRSRDATLRGLLTHTTTGENCMVWFDYGLTPACGTASKDRDWTNGTGTYDFNITIDGLKPGTKYYYRAVYEAVYGGGYKCRYRDPNISSFTTLINDLEVVSPQYSDSWIKGITHKIEWYYGPKLKGTNVTIELYIGKDPCYGAIDGYDYVELPINYSGTDKNGSFNWVIPKNLSSGKFIYRIKITSVFDQNIYDYSDYFSIRDIHEGIVWNRTITPTHEGDNRYRVNCGSSSCEGDESFNITMIKGILTRAEVYGLYYGGELCDCSFRGTVQIDLYNDSYCFGSIILLDSDSLTYESPSSSGTYISTIENGGLLYSDPNINKYLKKTPPIYAGGGVFSMHAIQIVASPFSAGGSNGFRIRVKTVVNVNSIREKDYVYNLRLQFYGDNSDLWLKYFRINYPVFERQGDTLFYTSSSTSKLWFVFSHTAIQISFV
ncbi:MAG: polymorphic toxin-type HINT domain-containing protein [Thermoplasmatota archaeon]|jgi:hypothetical protein